MDRLKRINGNLFLPNAPQGLLKQFILPCPRRSTTVVRYYSKQTISVW